MFRAKFSKTIILFYLVGAAAICCEAQQRAIDENPDRTFYNLNIDAGAVWARRLIDRMLEAERTPAPGPAQAAAE